MYLGWHFLTVEDKVYAQHFESQETRRQKHIQKIGSKKVVFFFEKSVYLERPLKWGPHFPKPGIGCWFGLIWKQGRL